MWFQKPPLGTPLDWGNPLNDGTVMALAMNEGHGDKVQDLSLNGNHGTLNNFAFPPTVASGWNPGQTGIGLKSDGIDDYINCGNNPTLNLNTTITMVATVNPATSSETGYIISKGTPTVDRRYNIYWNGGSDKLEVYDAGAARRSDAVFTESNSFVQVVITIDNLDIKFYKNGIPAGSDTLVAPFASNGDDLYLGNRVGGGSAATHFAGLIDQVRIQSRAWSAKEVRDYAINPWQVYLDE